MNSVTIGSCETENFINCKIVLLVSQDDIGNKRWIQYRARPISLTDTDKYRYRYRYIGIDILDIGIGIIGIGIGIG